MLTLWRRHNPQKCKLKGRQERKCRCAIWVSGVDEAGNKIKETTKLRDWTKAEALVRHWDNTGAKPVGTPRVTIEDWKKAFLADAESPAGRHLAPETIRLYKNLFKRIDEFAQREGYRFVNQLDLAALTAFRATWKDGPLTASKKVERLRGVLKFALRRKWITENAALELDLPEVKQNPTLPFTEDEMKKILKAAKNPRVHAFIQVMRYSGLRISDTATLAVAALVGNRLQLSQTKTGEPVSVLLPDSVAATLRELPHTKPEYFFWSGRSKVTSITGFWRARLADVFTKAKIVNGHSHRFRDTFAVSLLQAGVSLENVSTLLGHQSIRITEKHYSPWVKTRQDALDRELLRVNAAMSQEQNRNN
ncbi:MAG: tyrosine-type recombinase/integrase [Candidatus Acidiferrales bacterium]